ncbi:hyperosmotically inducible protein [Oxalobacteraceae bacterium GrIS 1.11]
MNKTISLALASAIGAMVFSAPVFAQSSGATSYQELSDKAGADFTSAKARCDADTGNAKKVCLEEAKLTHVRAEQDAVAEYKNTPHDLSKARADVANAEYDLAKTKCAERNGDDKNTCISEAKSARTVALADAKSGAQTAGAGTERDQRSVASTGVMENCEQMASTEKAGCMTRRAANSTKNVIADTVITTKIKADLVKEPDLKAMNVHVETDKGVVMLSGFVPSQAQADKAAELARGVDGVVEVKNNLKTNK